MTHRRSRSAVLLAALATATLLPVIPARGQAAPPAAPAAAPAVADAVAPFVDEATLAAAAVDASAVDVDAVRTWFTALMKRGGVPDATLAEMTRDLEAAAPQVKQVRDDLAKAGGRHVYFVWALRAQTVQVIAVVPVRQGGDPAAVRKLLTETLSKHSDGTAVVDEVAGGPAGGRVLLWGSADFVAGAKAAHADPQRTARPDLAAALAAGGTSPVRVAFAPTEQIKGVVVAAAPVLPKELGGGPVAPLASAFRSATLAMTAPTAAAPTAAVRLTVQARDADGATKLKAFADTAVGVARRQWPPGPATDKLFAAVAAQVAGDRLALDLGQDKIETVVTGALPALNAARAAALQQQSMSNARALALAMMMHAAEKRNALPASLDDLRPFLGMDEKATRAVLTSPRTGRYPGYVYVKPPVAKLTELKNTANTVLFHEAYDAWPAGGIVAGFADGHAEVIPTEDQLKAKLPK